MSDEKNRRTSSSKSSGTAGNSKSQSSAKKKAGETSSAKSSSAKSSSARSKNEDFYDYDVKNTRSSRESTKKQTDARGKQEKTEPQKLREPEQEKLKKQPDPSAPIHQIAIALLLAMALFVGICFAFKDDVGVIGGAIQNVFFGLFGLGALAVPFLLVQIALFWKRDVATGAVRYKYLVAIFFTIFLSVLIHAFYCLGRHYDELTFASMLSGADIKEMYTGGVAYRGGGFFGGVIGCALLCGIGYPGTIIFSLLFLVIFTMSLFGLTPMECIQRILFYRQRYKSAREREKILMAKRRAAREQKQAEAAARRTTAVSTRAAASTAPRRRADEPSHAHIDSDIFEDSAEFGKAEKKPASEPTPIKPKKGFEEPKKVKLDDIFDKKEDEAIFTRYAGIVDIGEREETETELPVTETKVDPPVSEEKPAPAPITINKPEATSEPVIEKKAPTTSPARDPHNPANPPIPPIRSMGDNMPEIIFEDEPEEGFDEPIAPISAQNRVEREVKPRIVHPEEKKEPDTITISPPDPTPEPTHDPDDEVFEAPMPPAYEFPPIELLQEGNTDYAGGDISAELRENADKIIQTLDSFNVRVKISNVSRGPTITRYEVEPSAGTRVRSIMNLLDDIALSLATSGVRSDGIITGKSAIGIEVPNKVTNTVYIRDLIEDSRFESAKSKLSACLGMDVSGAPVYLDIAKMPHLLIAGATGQGKSVCINSLIISLLYKARPDEVKLILIDPKKVELNIYNGIPHLLVPVVFEPKKAAGSLHWAVQEMERRFELIEAQNVRNIAQYNAAVADDPHKEKLPQVVIIIDELADLMMSAPDDVETSICRLAQKARAAGMHLIIGTQRPSVDVITGLIKANIPSRIAFTVSSQIDSRTIIDTQGAEKLIGRGDMLFAPVGSSKPTRVQGSFVSEKEIEEIVGFVKAQSAECSYSGDVIEQINKAAESCGQKKGKGGGAMAASAASEPTDEGEGNDPMLDAAIELAVESGKISTSLIQRRLSLGYGRAAKLIDVMERRGIVSAPEGQKPRTVLLTREKYLEMKAQSDASSTSGETV